MAEDSVRSRAFHMCSEIAIHPLKLIHISSHVSIIVLCGSVFCLLVVGVLGGVFAPPGRVRVGSFCFCASAAALR